MRKFLRWVSIILGVLVGIILIVVAGLYLYSESRINHVYDIPPSGLVVTSDPATVERGRHLTRNVMGCLFCHGENLDGEIWFEDPLTGRIAASNLTSGKGGVGQTYTDEDWIRALRHGVLPDGRAGIAMVSDMYYYISDADLIAMVAYIKSLPPVNNELPPTQLGLLGRLFVLTREDEALPAAAIDHTAPRPPDPVPGVTVEYGQYMARICTFCHNANYAGYADPSGEITDPLPANLTPSGDLAAWTEADFLTALRTGRKPDGDRINPDAMPWQSLGRMSDDELKAIWLFLQTLPPSEPAPPEF